jgi:hypothetical protein
MHGEGRIEENQGPRRAGAMPRSLRALLFPCLHTEIAPFVAPFVVIARDAIMDEHDLSLFSLFFG